MTEIGRFLRKLRIDYGEILYDMAKNLGVSTSFLSKVETGHKSPPLEWIDRISEFYDLDLPQRLELENAIYEAVNQVRLNVSDQPFEKRDLAIAFARRFDSMSTEDATAFLGILNRQNNKEG